MIGIPVNEKLTPEQVWQKNFRVIQNSMNETYGKKIINEIFEYYTDEVGIDKVVDFLLIQDKIRTENENDFEFINYGNFFFEQKNISYYKNTEELNKDEDDDENHSFIKKQTKIEYDYQLIKSRLFQYFIEELVEEIPQDSILRDEQDVIDFIKMYEVKFLYECLIPISEIKDTKNKN